MRKIFIVTERRADYSRFKLILKKIDEDPELEYNLVVTGMHLLKKYACRAKKQTKKLTFAPIK